MEEKDIKQAIADALASQLPALVTAEVAKQLPALVRAEVLSVSHSTQPIALAAKVCPSCGSPAHEIC